MHEQGSLARVNVLANFAQGLTRPQQAKQFRIRLVGRFKHYLTVATSLADSVEQLLQTT